MGVIRIAARRAERLVHSSLFFVYGNIRNPVPSFGVSISGDKFARQARP
jgi:hypothetical protein